MHADRLIGRQRPRGRGPDDSIGVSLDIDAERLAQRGLVNELEADIDRRRILVLVLDFRLCQRRPAVHAPVHRLGTLIQITVFVDFAERAHDVGLGSEIHGQIGTLPVAQHTEADEILLLSFHLLSGIFAAQLAEFRRGDILAVVLLHHQFDRQTVAIPTGHVRRIEAVQRLRLDDDVLQDLVDGVTDVDVAVGIGRAVVQDEFLGTGTRLADALVELLLLPLLQPLRLALGEVAAHGESGFR